MTEFSRQIDIYEHGYELAQAKFENKIESSMGNVALITSGSGLDVLASGSPDSMGFYRVEVDVKDYLTTPQMLGRVLLMDNPQAEVMSPTVIVPKPDRPGIIRLSQLIIPYVPSVGLTSGLKFGVALDAETQAPGFGAHGEGGQKPSAFEPGHFAVVLTAGADKSYGEALVRGGDTQTHSVIGKGLPNELGKLGLIDNLPKPRVKEIDITKFRPGIRYPLYWHPSLETEDGAAIAQYPGAVDLLIGAAINSMSSLEINRAGEYVDRAIRGA